MRISDWSSDVCSSDLPGPDDLVVHVGAPPPDVRCSFRADRLTRSLPRLQGAPNPICLSSAEGNIWAPVIWALSISPRRRPALLLRREAAADGGREIGRAHV